MRIKLLFLLVGVLWLTGCAQSTAGGQPALQSEIRQPDAETSSASPAARSGNKEAQGSDLQTASSALAWAHSDTPAATDGTFQYELQIESAGSPAK